MGLCDPKSQLMPGVSAAERIRQAEGICPEKAGKSWLPEHLQAGEFYGEDRQSEGLGMDSATTPCAPAYSLGISRFSKDRLWSDSQWLR